MFDFRKIVAVIVTRNRIDKLKVAYRKIICQHIEGLVIVNNLSSDETKPWLESLDEPRLVVYHSEKNLGGAGGFNIGFKIALKKYNCDWILCFDDDAYPYDNAIKNFLDLEIDSTVGGVAAAVFLPDGTICQMNRPIFNPFSNIKKFLPAFLKGEKNYHVPDSFYFKNYCMEIDASSFVGCFIRSSLVRGKLGFPRKDLFLYIDDLIYTLQIGKLGYKLLFSPTVKFIHDCETVNNGSVYPIWKLYYLIRNNIELLRKQAGFVFPFAFLSKVGSWLLKIRFFENKKLFMKVFFFAVLDGLRKDFSKDIDLIRLKFDGK